MSKVKIEGNASGTGVFTIAAPNSNTDRTLTLPDEAGTVLTSASDIPSDNLTGSVTVDGSGRVGIGTSTPQYKFDIKTGATSSSAAHIGETEYNEGGMFFTSTEESNATWSAGADKVSGNWTARREGSGSCISSAIAFQDATIRFYTDTGLTKDATFTPTERMRITNDGRLHIGSSSPAFGSLFTVTKNGSDVAGFHNSAGVAGANIVNIKGGANGTDNTTNYVLCQRNDGTNRGGIYASGATSLNYATSSDYRLKEDWQPMSGSIERLKNLNPVNFAWKTDGSRVDGFLAHEAAEVVPEAVTGEKDAMRTEEYEVTPAVLDDDGNVVTEAVMGTREVPDYQGIDQSKLVPLLTAALQEAVAKIEALETRIAALEVTP